MKNPASLHFSLQKDWAIPMLLLVICALGIIGFAISDVNSRSLETAYAASSPQTAVPAPWMETLEETLAKLPDAPSQEKKAVLLQEEIGSLQAALLDDLKLSTAARSPADLEKMEHDLARFSAAAEELRDTQRDFQIRLASLDSLRAQLSSGSPVANPAVPSFEVKPILKCCGLVLLAVMCVAAGIAMVLRIAETITRPVDHFVEIARAITRGRARQRASLEAAGHFRMLAEAFNQMVDARQQAEDRLQQAHDSLELKVQARTVELFRSNKALREESEQRAQAERDFQQAQKMDALGKLAGSIAHDFNNLLTVIIGGAECAQQQLAPDHAAVHLLQTVQQAGDRAAALTRPLLAFSRSQVLAFETVNLNSAAEEASRMLQRLVGVNIDLRLNLDPDLHMVKANSNQIQQVIVNLAVNARDAMNGFGTLTIITRSATVDEDARERAGGTESAQWVELAIADTGAGMDEATQARIFEPFFTTKPAGRGTGLGLATVFGIVKQTGGFLDVESAPGEGSTFRVFLPATAEVSSAPAPVSVIRAVPRSTGGETILLVDDEEEIRELATITLEAQGYRILSAPNAEEAILLGEKHATEIQALVTDVVMPGMTGVQLAGLLTRIIPGLRVLFVSGHNNESIAADADLAAQSDYLQKPYRGHVLAAKVREVLTAQRLRPAAAWSVEDLAEAG